MTLPEIQRLTALAISTGTLDAGTIERLANALDDLGEHQRAHSLRTLSRVQSAVESGSPLLQEKN